MTDIVLDAPNAYHTLSKFVEKGTEAGFVTQIIAEQVPNRYLIQYNVHHRSLNLLTHSPTHSLSAGDASVTSARVMVVLSSPPRTESLPMEFEAICPPDFCFCLLSTIKQFTV